MPRHVSAADLSAVITIQRNEPADNTLGEPEANWVNHLTCFADAQPLRGREFFAAGQTQVQSDVRFVIRWHGGIDETMRVLWNGQPLAVNAPAHVELKIVETDPGMRGDTATGGQKPAKLETGAVVRVPLFISEGEIVRVDTRTGEYLSRAKS